MRPEITNHYHPEMERPKLRTETHLVMGASEEWNYAHHPFLTRFRGRFFLCCSSGSHHEDDVGQRVVFSGSDDFAHWDPVRVLAEPEHPETDLFIPQGLYANEDTLVVYYLMLRYSPDALKDGHRRMGNQGRSILGHYYKTSTDGETWSEAKPLDAFGGNQAVIRLASGRLYSPGGQYQAWSDEQDGIHGWRQTKVFPDGWGNPPGEESQKDDDMPGLVSDTHVSLCEGAVIQRDGGDLLLYLRSATPWLWVSQSTDEGEHWTLPEQTRFTDNRTKFAMGRLPDGRYYYVGTPDPFPPRTRHVLALSLSRDGLDWTEHYLLADAQYKGRYPGIDKNGVYGYPSVLIADGAMHVAVSINKEMIIVIKAELNQL